MDEYGSDLIEVSSHVGARPRCAPYQGRLFSRRGKSGYTTDLNDTKVFYSSWASTSYGEAAGLLGINCGHQVYPFFPGLSRQTYHPYAEPENNQKYNESQGQRYHEGQVKKSKRECAMLDAMGDKEGFQKASALLKQREAALKNYCAGTGRAYKSDRVQVSGFGRSTSSKATAAKRFEVTSSTQKYKPVLRDTADYKEIKRGNTSIIADKAVNAQNDIYISKLVNIKPKQQNFIDNSISKTLRLLNAENATQLPSVVLVTADEMQTGALAAYNYMTNTLFLQDVACDKKTLLALQQGLAQPSNQLSTFVHEYIHWQDAKHYTETVGEITDSKEYITQLRAICKKKLDNASIDEYTVNKIGFYAEQSFKYQKYDETYTEFVVAQLLEKGAK